MHLWSRLAPLLSACLVATAACASPAAESGVCAGTGACGSGLCVVGRCRPKASPPAPEAARRLVLPPRDFTVLSGEISGGAGGVPEAVTLGAREGSTVVLFRFAASFREGADITSAFLVLDPIEGALLARQSVSVEVARILDPWDSATASWGRQPRLSLPEKAAPLRPRASAPARIDVTHFVREWSKRLPDDHGIALLLDGNDALGASYSMGVEGGAGPRLEVYVR